MRVLLLLFFHSTVAFAVEPRIVSGIVTDISKVPYQVSIRLNGSHICGGSIISKTFILTAAHCTHVHATPNVYHPPSAYLICMGTSNRLHCSNNRTVHDVKNHPDYIPDTIKNDISLLELTKLIKFGRTMQKISLPDPNEVLDTGATCLVTGWGSTNVEVSNPIAPELLHRVDLQILDVSTCISHYTDYGIDEASMVTRYCVGNMFDIRGSCNGDSGSPLVANKKLYGIVSAGDFVRCATPETPTLFTKVSSYRNWIKEHAKV